MKNFVQEKWNTKAVMWCCSSQTRPPILAPLEIDCTGLPSWLICSGYLSKSFQILMKNRWKFWSLFRSKAVRLYVFLSITSSNLGLIDEGDNWTYFKPRSHCDGTTSVKNSDLIRLCEYLEGLGKTHVCFRNVCSANSDELEYHCEALRWKIWKAHLCFAGRLHFDKRQIRETYHPCNLQ